MARRRAGSDATPEAEALDREVDEMLRRPDAGLSAGNAERTQLLELALALRDLPREAFRSALGRALRPALGARDLREEARTLAANEDRLLGSLDRASVLITRHHGLPPWERHPDGDELIVVLDGGGEITVLTEDGPVRSELRPGRIFVCPKGLWHRTDAQPEMTALYVTPLAGGEHSYAEDPRAGSPA